MASASPARATCEYSQRSRSSVQFTGPASLGRPRLLAEKSEKKLEPTRLSFLSWSHKLFTGLVNSQYTTCIPMSPSNATRVSQKRAVSSGVTIKRMIMEIMPRGTNTCDGESRIVDGLSGKVCIFRELQLSREFKGVGRRPGPSPKQRESWKQLGERQTWNCLLPVTFLSFTAV